MSAMGRSSFGTPQMPKQGRKEHARNLRMETRA